MLSKHSWKIDVFKQHQYFTSLHPEFIAVIHERL